MDNNLEIEDVMQDTRNIMSTHLVTKTDLSSKEKLPILRLKRKHGVISARNLEQKFIFEEKNLSLIAKTIATNKESLHDTFKITVERNSYDISNKPIINTLSYHNYSVNLKNFIEIYNATFPQQRLSLSDKQVCKPNFTEKREYLSIETISPTQETNDIVETELYLTSPQSNVSNSDTPKKIYIRAKNTDNNSKKLFLTLTQENYDTILKYMKQFHSFDITINNNGVTERHTITEVTTRDPFISGNKTTLTSFFLKLPKERLSSEKRQYHKNKVIEQIIAHHLHIRLKWSIVCCIIVTGLVALQKIFYNA